MICLVIAVVLFLIPFGGAAYGRVVLGLSHYLFWPFGQYVERDLYVGEARSSYHQQSMSTDSDRDPVFSGHGNGSARLSHLSPSEESRPLLLRSTSIVEAEKQHISLWAKIKNLPRTILELGLGGLVYYLFYYTIIGKEEIFPSYNRKTLMQQQLKRQSQYRSSAHVRVVPVLVYGGVDPYGKVHLCPGNTSSQEPTSTSFQTWKLLDSVQPKLRHLALYLRRHWSSVLQVHV